MKVRLREVLARVSWTTSTCLIKPVLRMDSTSHLLSGKLKLGILGRPSALAHLPDHPPGPRPASPPHLAPAHCGNPAEQFVGPRGIMSPGVHSHHALIPDTHPNFFFFKKLPLIFFSPFSLFPRLSSLTFLPSSLSLFISFFLFTHKRIAFPTMCSFLKNG